MRKRKKYRWNPKKRNRFLMGVALLILLIELGGFLSRSLGTGDESTLETSEYSFTPIVDTVRRHRIFGADEPAPIPLVAWARDVPPLIYIFNAHDHEVIGAASIETYNVGEMTIMEVSRYMADLFEARGIPVLVEERLQNPLIQERGWLWESHYRAARLFLEEAIKAHPTLQFFFDIHRDSLHDERIRTTIDGEPYATLLFVIGEGHPYAQENLAVVNELVNRLEARYPGIMRRDYLSDTMTPIQSMYAGGQTAVYFNQDLSENMILFEIGGPTSTVEEVLNTVHALVDILYDWIAS